MGFLAILSPGILLGSLHAGITIGLAKGLRAPRQELGDSENKGIRLSKAKPKKSGLMRKPVE